MRFTLVRLGIAALMIGTLAGCSGGGGGGGGSTPAVVTPPPTGTAPVTASSLSAIDFAALTPTVTISSVTVASPPKVTFSVTDAAGNAIIGLGSKSQSATATVASYPNFAFALAKLIPGVGTAPSRWVNYIVTTVPTKDATTGAITASVPTRPTTDNTGTLVDNGNGTYTYTFFRDITQAKAAVAAATLTAPNIAADLDDLTFDPSLVHRLTLQLSGDAPGTGKNTPDGVPVLPDVFMANPVNAIFDFVPATGIQQATAASGRDIVATAKCNECHQSLGGFPTASAANSDATFHGGNRNKIEYCVVCHTEQRKYGRPEATVVAGGNYDGLNTYRIHGLAVGNLKQHIHKIHMSENLTKVGYNYGGIAYETACRFPQDIRNCTKCHDATGSATSTFKTAQGDNWMNVPNRSACGACHDGIDFSTGKGVTLADAKKGLTATTIFPGGNAHGGGAQLNDDTCKVCHTKGTDLDIDLNHTPVTPPNLGNALLVTGGNANTNAAFIASNTSRLPAGAIKVTYEINSVSRNASKQPVMVFRMLQGGVAVPFNVFNPANPVATQEIWPNFMGAPSVYFAYAVPQDGILKPADFNASLSVYLRSLWNGTAVANAGGTTSGGTLTGPDATGFYTATLTLQIPDSAVMLTGGLGYSYSVLNTLPLTQTNLTTSIAQQQDFSTAPATAGGLTPGMPNRTGGLIVVAPDAQLVATAYTGRRPIVLDSQCNKCHQELGPFTEDAFHAGQRNDGTTCSWCHNPNQTNGGWSGDSTNFVHAIHAAAKRTVNFTWHAVSTTDGFWKIGYPGVLKTCVTCHTPDSFDFSAPASTSALPNRLYRTVATGTTAAATFTTSPYIAQTAGTVYGNGFSFNARTGVTVDAAATTLVNSPIATACFACHDDLLATAHMKSNGGSLYAARGTPGLVGGALANPEQCTLCHLTGKVADIRVMHQ